MYFPFSRLSRINPSMNHKTYFLISKQERTLWSDDALVRSCFGHSRRPRACATATCLLANAGGIRREKKTETKKKQNRRPKKNCCFEFFCLCAPRCESGSTGLVSNLTQDNFFCLDNFCCLLLSFVVFYYLLLSFVVFCLA